MTIKDVTPAVPKTFNIGLTATEAAPLIAAIKEQLGSIIPAAVLPGPLNYCNIRLPQGGGANQPAVQVSIQFTAPVIATTKPIVPVAVPEVAPVANTA